MNLRIKEICKSKNISLLELAESLNMKRESLSRSINGNPTIETLDKIASALNVPITELFEQPKKDSLNFACPHCGNIINLKVE